jgi:hypothetical protein
VGWSIAWRSSKAEGSFSSMLEAHSNMDSMLMNFQMNSYLIERWLLWRPRSMFLKNNEMEAKQRALADHYTMAPP